jgi:hypothetical protein
MGELLLPIAMPHTADRVAHETLRRQSLEANIAADCEAGTNQGQRDLLRVSTRWQSQRTTTGGTVSSSQRAIAVMRASSCCWPMSCTPTGMPLTLIRGTVTAGANSIELG